MLPKTRVRTATARPYSARNTPSISRTPTATPTLAAPRSVPGGILERPDLDGQAGDPGRGGRVAERRVQVGRVHDQEAADVLLALQVGAVGHDQVPGLFPDHGGRVGPVQAAAEHPRPVG